MELLAAGEALPGVWESLDLEGLVSRWLPEWGPVRNRPQRNAVHRWTVDRHQVQTCVEAQRFLREVSRPDLLLLACLLHDLGKRPGAPTTPATGGAAGPGRGHRGWASPQPTSRWCERLVLEHLTLVDLATRRDPDDPSTVEALVAAVGGRADVLTLLRALTEADALAAGPAAWCPWRARLVDDLVERARAMLRGEPAPGPAPLTEAEVAAGPGRARSTAAAGSASASSRACSRSPSSHPTGQGCSPTSPGCWPCTGSGCAPPWCAPWTGPRWTPGGWRPGGEVPDPAVLRVSLQRLEAGDTSVLERLARRDASVRLRRSADDRPAVVVVPDASDTATVLEVRSQDRPGLLTALGRALAEAAVDIRSAHVATHAGQAVDVLYVVEASTGAPLSPPRVGEVVAALLEAADPELAASTGAAHRGGADARH